MSNKYFGMEFQVYPASNYPSKAHTWKTLKEVKEKYEEFCMDCDKFGQQPLDHWLYIGKPDGNEDLTGYPDYPDYIIAQGPRGGIKISKA